MKRQLQGIIVILLSLLLVLVFDNSGWRYVFDFDLQWAHIFGLMGIAGALWVFIPEMKKY